MAKTARVTYRKQTARCLRVLSGFLPFLGACISDNEENAGMMIVPGVEVVADSQQSRGTFEFLGYLTTTEGSSATERISALSSAGSDGAVLVADLPTCRVLEFQISTRALVRELGQCGEGPGEFSFIGGVGGAGDTIVVYDAGRREFSVFAASDDMIRRVSLLDRLPERFGAFEWNGILPSGAHLLTRAASASEDGGVLDWRKPLVAARLRGDSTVLESINLGIAPLAEESARRTSGRPPILRACAANTGAGGSDGYLVATHGLGAEAVVLSSGMRPRVHTWTNIRWLEATLDSVGRLRLGADRWYVACGVDMFALGYRSFEGSDERGEDTRGHLQVRTYDGSLVASAHWGIDAPQAAVLGAPKALFGDTLVTVRVDDAGWQRVALWRVLP